MLIQKLPLSAKLPDIPPEVQERGVDADVHVDIHVRVNSVSVAAIS